MPAKRREVTAQEPIGFTVDSLGKTSRSEIFGKTDFAVEGSRKLTGHPPISHRGTECFGGVEIDSKRRFPQMETKEAKLSLRRKPQDP